MAAEYPIRAISVDEFPAFYAVLEHAFNPSLATELGLRLELATFEADRSLAAFDAASIVGTASAYTFQMAVPGAVAGVAGVSLVSVLPSHRRRGILSSMMRRQLAELHDHGEAVAALFASESGIYARYGYGAASAELRFTVRRGESQLTPLAAAGRRQLGGAGPVRIADPRGSTDELAKVYDAVFPGRPGMYARDSRWWDSRLADPEQARGGAGPLRCIIAGDSAGPRGYALFAVRQDWDDDGLPAGVLTVKELMAADPAAYATLWSELLTRDLVAEVRAPMRPLDDPLPQLLADPRRTRTQVTDGLWIRLIDVPRALSQRRYACAVDTVIEVNDDILAANTGRWRLKADGQSGSASCERTSAPADVALRVQALGATYLGGTRLGALAGAGLVAELRPGALAALSTALSADPAPWCPTIF